MARKSHKAMIRQEVLKMKRPFTAEMVQERIFEQGWKDVPSRSSITNVMLQEHLVVKVGHQCLTFKQGYYRRPTLYEVVV